MSPSVGTMAHLERAGTRDAVGRSGLGQDHTGGERPYRCRKPLPVPAAVWGSCSPLTMVM